jgi:hypothetical protein
MIRDMLRQASSETDGSMNKLEKCITIEDQSGMKKSVCFENQSSV